MVVLLGSVTDLTPAHGGRHVVVGSHGGRATGRYALRFGVASLVCHDAGIGLEDAGVRALDIFEQAGLPAAAISHASARIGDPDDMVARGVISRVNACARTLGIHPGSTAVDALVALRRITSPVTGSTQMPSQEHPFERRDIEVEASGRPSARATVVLADSASSLGPADDGLIVVTGSHGGLPGNASARAAKARPLLAVFNDAGIGIEEAGIRRLPVLDAEGIAAACIDAASARIGEARSTYETGVLSVVNNEAARLGATVGMSVRALVQHWVDQTTDVAVARHHQHRRKPNQRP